jgi:Mn2+/Fe2+ NRAMP family transporter
MTWPWVMLFSFPLIAAIQEVCARIGRVTGQGIADIRRHYSRWLLRAIVLLLLVANTINLGADLGAMGEALRLLIGRLYVVAFAVGCMTTEGTRSLPKRSTTEILFHSRPPKDEDNMSSEIGP